MSAVPIEDYNAVELVLLKSKDPAALPQVVFKIMEMTVADDSSASTIEREIVFDPGFSAKVLAQANSAAFAMPKRVTSIREAVMFLGFKAVRQLAMTVGIFDMFVGKTDKESLRRRGWWKHSLDSAIAAKHLASSYGTWNEDEAYTAGLLHYIGKTLMCRFDPSLYGKVEMLMEHGATELMAEQSVYHCDHVEVVMFAGTKWGIPASLLEGLRYIDAPAIDDPAAKFKATIALADGIVKISAAGPEGDAQVQRFLPTWACEILDISAPRQGQLIQGALAAVASATKTGKE